MPLLIQLQKKRGGRQDINQIYKYDKVILQMYENYLTVLRKELLSSKLCHCIIFS